MAAATAPMPPFGRAMPACLPTRCPARRLKRRSSELGERGPEMGAEHRIEGDDALQAVVFNSSSSTSATLISMRRMNSRMSSRPRPADLEAEARKLQHVVAAADPRRGGVMSLKGRSTAAKRISFCRSSLPGRALGAVERAARSSRRSCLRAPGDRPEATVPSSKDWWRQGRDRGASDRARAPPVDRADRADGRRC